MLNVEGTAGTDVSPMARTGNIHHIDQIRYHKPVRSKFSTSNAEFYHVFYHPNHQSTPDSDPSCPPSVGIAPPSA